MNYLAPEVTAPVYLAASDLGTLFRQEVTPRIGNLVTAVLFLIVGLFVASLVSGAIRGILKRTDLDNKVAAWLTGQEGSEAPPIEQWAASLVFWLIFLFAIIGFLDALELEVVSEPLNALLEEVTSFLPQLFIAGVLLAGAWLLATAIKIAAGRILRTMNIDGRLDEQTGGSGFSTSDAISNGLFWLILLVFLPGILSTLQLSGTLLPVQGLVDDILGFLPDALGAAIWFAIGWFVALFVRRVVTSFFASIGVDNLGARLGLGATEERQPLSGIIGTVVFVFVLIPVGIGALERLKITAVSEAATTILDQVFGAMPKIFVALLILSIAYLIGQVVSELLSGILAQLGFNDILRQLGVNQADSTAPSATPSADDGNEIKIQTPSELAGTIAQVGIVLVGVFAAVDRLEIDALSVFVGGLVEISGRVLVGALVFGAGLFLANFTFRTIQSAGMASSNIVAQAARVGIIAFVAALALNVIGIATSIVNLAFGLLLGAIAVALAIAFGWGGRDIAGELLREWLNELRR